MECIYPARPTFGEAVGMANAFTRAGDLAEYLRRAKVQGRRHCNDNCALAWHFLTMVPDAPSVEVSPASTPGRRPAMVVITGHYAYELGPVANLFIDRFDAGHYPELECGGANQLTSGS